MILNSCSSDPLPQAQQVEGKAVVAKAVWFNVPKRFSTPNQMGDVETHPFFDLNAYRLKSSSEISYFMVTPLDSEHQYELDMVSGQRFLRHSYCKEDDVWEEYEGSIYRPNFAQGIVPRLMDQTGRPQQVWVFGDKSKFFTSKNELRVQSQRANIVGGVVVQYCEKYPCKFKNEWLSRLVLIGVNPFDKTYEGVENLKDLKMKVDWEYSLGFARNAFGRNMSSQLGEPAYRIGGEIDKEEVLDFAFDNGHLFDFEEINSMRKNCFRLYDYIWNSQKKSRKLSKLSNKKKDQYDIAHERKAKEIQGLRAFKTRRVFKDNASIVADIKVKKEDSFKFEDFWLRLLNQNSARMKTCFDFVRAANSKESKERTWFFAYVQNWINLEELGYYYSCSRRSWLENPYISKDKRRYPKHATKGCSAKDLDIGFRQAITVMASLSTSLRPNYRFIEYDSRIGGSHALLFNWVFDNGKRMSCNPRKLEEKERLFPEDVSWHGFESKEESLLINATL